MNTKRKSIVAVSTDGTYAVSALFDRNHQLCDIQPRVQGKFVDGRFHSVTQETLNMYHGQPYDICREEVLINLKWISDNERNTLEEDFAEPSESAEEE
nr:MAG TPA: hypothetical protein [Bacteriophage sp.]